MMNRYVTETLVADRMQARLDAASQHRLRTGAAGVVVRTSAPAAPARSGLRQLLARLAHRDAPGAIRRAGQLDCASAALPARRS